MMCLWCLLCAVLHVVLCRKLVGFSLDFFGESSSAAAFRVAAAAAAGISQVAHVVNSCVGLGVVPHCAPVFVLHLLHLGTPGTAAGVGSLYLVCRVAHKDLTVLSCLPALLLCMYSNAVVVPHQSWCA
jgi:uncharacterized MAPEG superfamily protein